ncbi:MAG: Translation initiation factor IF-3 [Candidatus Magasanikbacteria bacterium GW2011_GWC2_45_8]|uniref:Translation initiation factor IF-3 n=1 Tax=Candidatus Magasanikbacteria bacterium GW2011_GWC2_45_8 TaxID=1619050 RepID=A0A0G1MZT4_9BACT|nr:MAG: Translation initiation factor IF-3 [Candidatus Magasanikbacteria bacterium GW2011_GWC2_45_8]HBW73743.1 translation initiation factor IF-3 [Candidatus Magasanikbacteria bacterium]
MRISRHRRSRPREEPIIQHKYKVNHFINSSELRVIDENGENLGVLPTHKALAIAEERGFDLVEVNPIAQPPIAKILNYGQFKYEKEKELKKQKSKSKEVELKGIRLSTRIGVGDRAVRLKQAGEFLKEGNKVRVEIILKGRERQFSHLANEVILQFVDSVKKEIPCHIEQDLTRQGGKISLVITKSGVKD